MLALKSTNVSKTGVCVRGGGVGGGGVWGVWGGTAVVDEATTHDGVTENRCRTNNSEVIF